MQAQTQSKDLNKVNFLVDAVIFLAFLIAMEPHATGMAIHEWLGIAFGAAIITHLLLHWRWLTEVTRRFLGKMPLRIRLNYILNTLFFIDMTVIILSGVMMSKSALPALGISLGSGMAWKALHSLSADLGMLIVGLHVALHWRWIVHTAKQLVSMPKMALRGKTDLNEDRVA